MAANRDERERFAKWLHEVQLYLVREHAVGPAAPEPADDRPAARGTTNTSRDREDADWPVIKSHRLLITWDKQEDRMVARIVTGPTIRTEEREKQ